MPDRDAPSTSCFPAARGGRHLLRLPGVPRGQLHDGAGAGVYGGGAWPAGWLGLAALQQNMAALPGEAFVSMASQKHQPGIWTVHAPCPVPQVLRAGAPSGRRDVHVQLSGGCGGERRPWPAECSLHSQAPHSCKIIPRLIDTHSFRCIDGSSAHQQSQLEPLRCCARCALVRAASCKQGCLLSLFTVAPHPAIVYIARQPVRPTWPSPGGSSR